MLKVRAEITMVHIPYKGCAPAQIDALSGQVPVIFSPVTNFEFCARGDYVGTRLVMPSVPTVAESGFPGSRCRTGPVCSRQRRRRQR